MTVEIALVFGILLGAIVLFATEWIGMDPTARLVLVADALRDRGLEPFGLFAFTPHRRRDPGHRDPRSWPRRAVTSSPGGV